MLTKDSPGESSSGGSSSKAPRPLCLHWSGSEWLRKFCFRKEQAENIYPMRWDNLARFASIWPSKIRIHAPGIEDPVWVEGLFEALVDVLHGGGLTAHQLFGPLACGMCR